MNELSEFTFVLGMLLAFSAVLTLAFCATACFMVWCETKHNNQPTLESTQEPNQENKNG